MNQTIPQAETVSGRKKRITHLLLLELAGAAMGYIGAFLVWGYIYSIGSSVVSDDTYASLRNVIPRHGAIAGLCTGAASSYLPSTWRIGGLVAMQMAAVVVGMAAGSQGWIEGLIGYFGAHVIAIIYCFARRQCRVDRSAT